MTRALIVAAAFFIATGAASAEPGDETAAAAAADVAADRSAKEEKKVCKTEKITGSLTRVRRICATQREWDEVAAGTNYVLNKMGRSAAEAESLKGNPSAAASAMSGT